MTTSRPDGDPALRVDPATVVHTDRSCLYADPQASAGPGGWAWIIMADGRRDSGAAAETTNQRMELVAVVEAVESVAGPVEVVTDSAYVADQVQRRQWQVRARRRWRNAAGKPVAHRDLWERLAPHVDSGRVQVSKVKGHSGDAGNDMANAMATAAAAGARA